MRLPRWFPPVSEPWNPAYKDTWRAMSREERQWSLFYDLVLVAIVIGVCVFLSGCQRVDDPSQPRGDTAERCRVATMPESSCDRPAPAPRPARSVQGDYDLIVDEETGCRYWSESYGHNLTPQWAWGGSGLYIKGCRQQ